MSRSLLTAAAALMATAILPQVPATAQDYGSIVVQGPRVENSGEAKVGVHPTMALVTQVSVPTYDLDLRTDYGRDVLDHRVNLAADQVCERIDELVPVYGLGPDPVRASRDCRIEARRSAMSQVRAAAWAAG